MTDYPRREIERIRDAIEDAEGVSDADAEVLLEFSDQIDLLGASKYSDQRHEFLLKRCERMAKGPGGLADALEDKDAAEDIVRWINRTYDNPETNKDFRTALRVFGGILTPGDVDDKPESIDWVPGGYPKNYDPAPEPGKMYAWDEHVLPMIEAANCSRDRAIVALSWDLGPRASELFDLTYGDVSDHEFGLQASITNGKTGSRSPILVPSVYWVKEWRADHPGGDDDDPLWTHLKRPEPISNNRVRDVLKECAERADMDPPSTPTPTRMRKSSASHLASEGVSQAHLEDHHGWKRGSSVAARYIATFDDANDREIAIAHGLEVEHESSSSGPIPCPRCSQQSPPGSEECVWCGQALTHSAAEQAEEQRAKAMESIAENPELADAIMTIEDALGVDVGLRADGFES